MLGVAVGTMAMVVVMSAINGLTELVENLYSSFDASIRIEAAHGKYITVDDLPMQDILSDGRVTNSTRTLEETVLIKYEDAQVFATVKGVDESFVDISGLDSSIWSGSSTLTAEDGRQFVTVGYMLARNLGINLSNVFQPLQFYTANPTANLATSMTSAFYVESIFPAGIFAINADLDNQYVVAPISFVQKLVRDFNRVSSVELEVVPETNLNQLRDDLQLIVGNQFDVKTRFQLNEMLYKTNNTEKWAVFLILSFILLIATFNILGSLTMLILDKKEDLFILSSMGANNNFLRSVFIWEGLLIAFIGGAIGLLFGLVLCWLQEEFKLVALQGMLVDSYPIQIIWSDLAAIVLVVFLIGLLAAGIPSALIIKRKTV